MKKHEYIDYIHDILDFIIEIEDFIKELDYNILNIVVKE